MFAWMVSSSEIWSTRRPRSSSFPGPMSSYRLKSWSTFRWSCLSSSIASTAGSVLTPDPAASPKGSLGMPMSIRPSFFRVPSSRRWARSAGVYPVERITTLPQWLFFVLRAPDTKPATPSWTWRTRLPVAAATVREEPAEQQGGLVRANARDHLDPVVESLVPDKVPEGAREPCLGIGGAVDEPLDPSQDHRPGAHGAGPERDVQRAAVQPPGPHAVGCLPHGQDLGMGRGVLEPLPLVSGRRHDLLAANHHRTDRHVAPVEAAFGLLERGPHEAVVGRLFPLHGDSLPD